MEDTLVEKLKRIMQQREGLTFLEFLDGEISLVSNIGNAPDEESDFKAQKKLYLKLKAMREYLASLSKQYTEEELDSFE